MQLGVILLVTLGGLYVKQAGATFNLGTNSVFTQVMRKP
jgi:hypothetical protein